MKEQLAALVAQFWAQEVNDEAAMADAMLAAALAVAA